MTPRAARAFALVALLGAGAWGCGSDRIDPPPEGVLSDGSEVETGGDPDSLVAWAKRAREGWASGEPARADAAGALARDAFAAAWSDLAQDKDDALAGERAERLPHRVIDLTPDAASVIEALTRVGLAADIVVAAGQSVLWQVIVRDPTGGAGALTEFYAWPDPDAPSGAPIVQSLPANAPARAHHGPDAVGALQTYGAKDGVGFASAWARPRGRVGLEVGLGQRGAKGRAARTWKISGHRTLPVAVDSVRFEGDVGGEGRPALVVVGAGARDLLFDDCPNCPRLERVQRYVYRGDSWSLASESIAQTPYASFVSFLHAMSQGTPESALPYADGPPVLEQAMALGLDRRPPAPLRAALGTTATDLTQRYRIGPQHAIEVTLEPRGERWVVVDLRETTLAIE